MRTDIEQFLGSLQAVNRHLRSIAFDPERHRITRVQWMLLRRLKHRGGMTIGQLAEHLDVRASTMSQMLDRLERSGYVRREADNQDARVKTIRLTEAGLAVIEQTEQAWTEALADPFDRLDDEERASLARLMKKLSDQLPGRGAR